MSDEEDGTMVVTLQHTYRHYGVCRQAAIATVYYRYCIELMSVNTIWRALVIINYYYGASILVTDGYTASVASCRH